MIHFTNVDLPSPFFPTNATFSPLLIVRFTSWKTCLAYVFTDNRIIPAAAGRRKFQTEGRVVFLIDLDTVYLFQLFDTTLHLYGFGCLIAETFDKVFRILYLLLLILVST